MEERIRARYHEGILAEARRHYAIDPDAIRSLNAFESFIFEFNHDEAAYILRLSHSLRRSVGLILGEVDWLNYLAAGGVSVARAMPSPAGRLVEVIDDSQGGRFLATAFVRAPGQPSWDAGWTPAHYATYGHLIGRMHALTKTYTLREPAWRRPAWNDPSMLYVDRYLPAAQRVVHQRYRTLYDQLLALPTGPEDYGLVHYDAHGSNLFIADDGTLTLFDFDDCAYTWFANDVAVVLFYMLSGAPDPAALTAEFMPPFLAGYQRAQPFKPRWLDEIPYFLKLRELELYAVIHRDFDVENIDHPWVARFMNGRQERLEEDTPYVDFDFAALA